MGKRTLQSLINRGFPSGRVEMDVARLRALTHSTPTMIAGVGL